MKSLSLFHSERTLARHDDRAPRRQPACPRTDYRFHSPIEEPVTVQERDAATRRADLRAFRQISTEYLGEKNYRGYLVDFAVYALVTGLCVWSLISLGILVFQAMTD